jgi:hypothetical protein
MKHEAAVDAFSRGHGEGTGRSVEPLTRAARAGWIRQGMDLLEMTRGTSIEAHICYAENNHDLHALPRSIMGS